MSERRNHPKPEHVDPFDLPEHIGEREVVVWVRPSRAITGQVDAGDRVELRRAVRTPSERRRHATG